MDSRSPLDEFYGLKCFVHVSDRHEIGEVHHRRSSARVAVLQPDEVSHRSLGNHATLSQSVVGGESVDGGGRIGLLGWLQ